MNVDGGGLVRQHGTKGEWEVDGHGKKLTTKEKDDEVKIFEVGTAKGGKDYL